LIENTAESPAGSIEPGSERDENSSGRTIQINRLRGLAAPHQISIKNSPNMGSAKRGVLLGDFMA
jgi:hypothetical protein